MIRLGVGKSPSPVLGSVSRSFESPKVESLDLPDKNTPFLKRRCCIDFDDLGRGLLRRGGVCIGVISAIILVGMSGSRFWDAAKVECNEHQEVEELSSRSANHLYRKPSSGLAPDRSHAPDVSVLDPRARVLCSRTDCRHGSNWSARLEKKRCALIGESDEMIALEDNVVRYFTRGSRILERLQSSGRISRIERLGKRH